MARSAADVRREAMERAMAAVANFDPSETAGDGLLCSVCGEECALQDSGTHELRLCRYSCARPGGNCDWRLCYFCANGLKSGKAVVCGVCGISVRDHDDAAHDYSADGLSGDSEEEVDDDHHQPHEDAYDEDCGSWQGGRGRGRGSGVGQSAHRTHAGADQAAPPAAAAIDDMFAMGLPTGMPSLPPAVATNVDLTGEPHLVSSHIAPYTLVPLPGGKTLAVLNVNSQ